MTGTISGSGSVVINGFASYASLNSYTGGTTINAGSTLNADSQYLHGTITGADWFETYSDATDPSFTKGADYSITNAGTITSPNDLEFYANAYIGAAGNGSTGSFTNTGTLQFGTYGELEAYANNNISLGGKLQIVNGTAVTAVSASNPLDYLEL